MAPSRERETFRKLSVFYPMWNEEDYIERALRFGKRACEDLVATGDIADYELIIIDDKSTDRTPEIADAMAAADPHIRVIHHDRNRKLGGSMKTGYTVSWPRSSSRSGFTETVPSPTVTGNSAEASLSPGWERSSAAASVAAFSAALVERS